MDFKISWNEMLKNFLQKILSQWTNKVPVLASAARIKEELAKD